MTVIVWAGFGGWGREHQLQCLKLAKDPTSQEAAILTLYEVLKKPGDKMR